MARTPLAPLTFGVVYFTKCNVPISVGKIEARDYVAACKIAWTEAGKSRKQIADFQLIEDPWVIHAGPQHVRAAAVKILSMHEAAWRDCDHRFDALDLAEA